MVWQEGGSFCGVLRGGQSRCQSQFWHVHIWFQVSSINSTTSSFGLYDRGQQGSDGMQFCHLCLLRSCVSGAADKKHHNTVDLFSEINPKVCRVWPRKCPVFLLKPIQRLHHIFYHTGIQTQAHWQIGVVLFEEGAAGDILASAYQTQGEGHCHFWKARLIHFTVTQDSSILTFILCYNLDYLPSGQLAECWFQ